MAYPFLSDATEFLRELDLRHARAGKEIEFIRLQLADLEGELKALEECLSRGPQLMARADLVCPYCYIGNGEDHQMIQESDSVDQLKCQKCGECVACSPLPRQEQS